MGLLPFDSELGIEAARLRQGGRRLFHLALQRVSRGRTPVRVVSAPADVDCLVVFLDSRVDVAKTKFCVTQSHQPQNQLSDRADLAASRVARRISLVRSGRGQVRRCLAPLYRPGSSGLMASPASAALSPSFARPELDQVQAFHIVRPRIIWGERDGPVGLTEYFRLVIGPGGRRSPRVFQQIGVSVARQRVGFVRVDLERLFEQGFRRIVVLFRPLLPALPATPRPNRALRDRQRPGFWNGCPSPPPS